MGDQHYRLMMVSETGKQADPDPDDIVAHLRALPHADRVALLVALLRAEPDAAVEAVDSCRVLRPWERSERESRRAPLCRGRDDTGLRPRVYGMTDGAWVYGQIENTSREAVEGVVDADMRSYGCALATGSRS